MASTDLSIVVTPTHVHFDHFDHFFYLADGCCLSIRQFVCHACCLVVSFATSSVQLCPLVLSCVHFWMFGCVVCDFEGPVVSTCVLFGRVVSDVECPLVSTCVLFATLCHSTFTFLSTAHHFYLAWKPG